MSIVGDSQKNAFCYFHEDTVRMVPLNRGSSELVGLQSSKTSGYGYVLPFDERERRVLIGFDGDVPWCGIPRSGTEIHSELLWSGMLPVRTEAHERKPRPFELPDQRQWVEGALDTAPRLFLKRRFLLLPCGDAFITRYREPSLTAVHCLVRVQRRSNGNTEVTFINASY